MAHSSWFYYFIYLHSNSKLISYEKNIIYYSDVSERHVAVM